NDQGQIVGFGQYRGQPRTFLLTQTSNTSDPPPGALTVSEVLSSQSLYLGQRIAVQGRIQIVPAYSKAPCGPGVQSCNPIVGVTVFLQDLADRTKQLLIYDNGNLYS